MGVPAKMQVAKFSFRHISASEQRIFKILVSTTHDYFMDKNYIDWIIWSRDKILMKFVNLPFFHVTPFIISFSCHCQTVKLKLVWPIIVISSLAFVKP
jgi:hypothetical protein